MRLFPKLVANYVEVEEEEYAEAMAEENGGRDGRGGG